MFLNSKNNERLIMMLSKKILIGVVMLTLVLDVFAQTRPVPTQRQMDWMDMERYAFIHFSINTFTDQEWGYGNEPVELFNPEELDCFQWARVCKEAGLTGIILTAKHHSGFCLWPSKYTDYSVKASPWRNGKGDVVRELRNACDKYGLKLGIYLSPWDRNRADYGQPSYIEYFRNQLTELLTEYGDIFEVWFDGANGGLGYYGGANENRIIDRSTYYDWPNTVELVRKLQPDCVIWNEAGPDIRWCGSEQGIVGETNWSRYDYSSHVPGEPDYTTLPYGEPEASDFVPAEVNVSIRPGWFYHRFEDLKVKNLYKLSNIYYNSVGRNSTLLLNFPIDERGLIHERDAKMAIEFNRFLKESYKNNLAKKAAVTTGDNTTTLKFKKAVTFNQIILLEDIRHGQCVEKFHIEAQTGGKWVKIADGTTVGRKRIVRFPKIKAEAVKVVCETENNDCLSDFQVQLYNVKEIPEPVDNEHYDLDRSSWKLVSPYVEDARLMFDGNKQTMMWTDKGLPLDLVIDMGEPNTLKGFRYLPDQGDYFLRGIITHYEFAVSLDGEKWDDISKGEFSNIDHNPLWQYVMFDNSVRARYIRFRAIRNSKGWGDFGCSEFDVLLK